MARKLCIEIDELRDRQDFVERILDKYNMFRMDGRASFRGATWELSELHIAQWTAASSLPLDSADSYARFINGGLEIRGGQIDVHSSEGTERMEIDGSGIRGYAGGVLKVKIDAATGLITATGGTIGGWTLAATSLTGGNATLHNSGYMLLGTGNDIARMDAADATWRLWIGHATNTSAPFRVDKNGNLVATSATITGTMQSANYVSNVSGWKIDNAGRAEFQDVIVRGEMHCAVFVKDLIDARAGTMIIAKSAGVLSYDIAVPAAGTWHIYVNDPPSGAAFLFANNDECQINSEYVTGVRNLWFTVSARIDVGNGTQRYTCTYTAGTRNVTYYAGSPIIDYGVANQGLLRMTAEPALNGPYYEILTTAGAPWTPDFVIQSRWGNLNGSYGYGATTFGMGIGSYGVANSITVDATNGIRFFDATPTLRAQFSAGVWTLGDTTNEHINISSTAVQFKDGATVHTDISGGNVTIGPVGANLSNVYITAGAFSLRDNVTERIGLSAGGILTVKDSGGNAVITLDAALGAEITKKLTIPGASSAISIGAVPPTASNAGTGIWIDRTGMYGLNANVLQAKFDAVTGTITAGAGAVVLDVNGVTIEVVNAVSDIRSYKFKDSGDNILATLASYFTANINFAQLGVYSGLNKQHRLDLRTISLTTWPAEIRIEATSALVTSSIICRADDDAAVVSEVELTTTLVDINATTVEISGGLNVGTASGAGVGEIFTSGKMGIKTSTIPHGGVGYATFAIDGPNASAIGPHVQITTDTDNYPLLQVLAWTHDNISLLFDVYYDGAFKSSDAGSNFLITKNSDQLQFNYDSGVAAGAGVAMNIGVMMNASGGVFMYALKSGANQGAAGAAANELWVDTDDQTIKLGT